MTQHTKTPQLRKHKEVQQSEHHLLAMGRTAEIYAWGDGQILKLFYLGAAAHKAEDEATLTAKLGQAGLPVPAVQGITYVRGRYGILFERLEGATMLTELKRRPWSLPHLSHLMAQLHADIHRHSLEALPSLTEHLERAIGRTALPQVQKQELVSRLYSLPEGNVVCHNDFHPDNILLTQPGAVVIDWATVKRGHPLADVARTFLLLKIAAPLPGTSRRWLLETGRGLFRSRYLQTYQRLHGTTWQQLEAWLPIVAAARLAEKIAGEEQQLMAIINTYLRSP